MKFVMFFIYGILFTMLSASLAVKCGLNQGPRVCQPCIITCYGFKMHFMCPWNCRKGDTKCFCRNGMVYNSKGVCIPIGSCH
ncbi:unnamed protein product [Callosobruchus maculatus]|uniref:TIL domain-containing protein n=1 Tax=Callosobruchus maculatus TaxID=64391 RepID=A0A653D6Y0_CALMS|nr:unnamed protein product [Callosobruchus maculatus]